MTLENTNKSDMLSVIRSALVEMALAWAISICYVYDPDKTYSYLKKMRTNDAVLDDFTYNKALQKITESNQVSQERKAKVRLMKRAKKA